MSSFTAKKHDTWPPPSAVIDRRRRQGCPTPLKRRHFQIENQWRCKPRECKRCHTTKKVTAERIIGKFREGESLASSREGGPR